jgi:hypothetical protein
MAKLNIEIGGNLWLAKLPELASFLAAAGCHEYGSEGIVSDSEMEEILESHHNPATKCALGLYVDEEDYDPDAVKKLTVYCREQGLVLILDYHRDLDTDTMLEVHWPGLEVQHVWLDSNDSAVLSRSDLTGLARAGASIVDAIKSLDIPITPKFEIYG